MLVNRENQILNSMSFRRFRGEAAGLNTASAQVAVIQGILDSYRMTGNKQDIDLALKYLTAGTSFILEKRNTADTQSAVASATTADADREKQDVQAVAVNFVSGVAQVPNAVDVLRVVSAAATLQWAHPFADLTSGVEYGIYSKVQTPTGVTVTLDTTITTALKAYVAYETGVSISNGVEVSTWPALTQVYSRDTQTDAAVFDQIDRMLTEMADLSGDTQWSDLAEILYASLVNDIKTASSLQWVAPTWATTPLAVAGRSISGARLPVPDVVRSQQGTIIISALAATTLGASVFAQAVTPITLTSTDTITVRQAISGVSGYRLTLVGVGGGRWYADVPGVASEVTIAADTLKDSVSDVEALPSQAIVSLEISHTTDTAFVFELSGIRLNRETLDFLVPAIQYTLSENPTWVGPAAVADQLLGAYGRRNGPAVNVSNFIRESFSGTWFRPYYYLPRYDAITYGAYGSYGFDSPTAYQHNGDAQYITLTKLAEYDRAVGTLSAEVESFAQFLASDEVWHPMQPTVADQWCDVVDAAMCFTDGQAFNPLHNPYGPPTRYDDTLYDIEYPDPYMAALVLSALVDIDATQRTIPGAPASLLVRALLSKAIALLDALEVTSGTMRGSFSPDPGEPHWHGVWHGQITSAVAKAFRWAMPDIADIPSLVARCQRWLPGLNSFLAVNTESVTRDYVGRVWDHAPNWATQIDESFTFSTRTVTARTGKEQRIATRTQPRRRITYTQQDHQLRPSDAVAKLMYSQNKPYYVPNWHLGVRLGASAAAGAARFQLSQPEVSLLNAGATVVLADGDTTDTYTVSYSDGNIVYTVEPLRRNYSTYTTAYPANLGLLQEEQVSTWLTNSVSTQSVICEFLPQNDTRVLPDRPVEWQQFIIDAADSWSVIVTNSPCFLPVPGMPVPGPFAFPVQTFTTGGQTLELVTWLNNWRDPVQISSIWPVDTLSKDDGPVDVLGGAVEGIQRISRTWTIYEEWQMIEALSFIKRMKGSQKAFWLPVAVSNLMLDGDQVGGTSVTVLDCEATRLGLLLKPYIGIAIVESDGTVLPAKVLSQSGAGVGPVILNLDRPLLEGRDIPSRYTLCLVVRVRQGGDMATISHITKGKAELKITMQTIQVLNGD